MPYIDDQNPLLNVSDDNIQQGNKLLVAFYQSDAANFIPTLDDLVLLFEDKKPHHDYTNASTSFYELLTHFMGSKATEKEFLRKYELIKLLHTAKTNLQIAEEEFLKFCTLVQLNQDNSSQDLLISLIEANLPPVMVNVLINIVPGYLLVKEALPQSIIHIYLPDNLKNDKSKKVHRITELKSLANNIAAHFNESLVLDLSDHSQTSAPDSHNGKSPPMPPKRNVNRKIDFDTEIEMRDLGTNNTKTISPKWSSKSKKAYIQLFLFKNIASDPRVMESGDGKLFNRSQEAIEKICTIVSHYVEPKLKSEYEDQQGFKINKYAQNHKNFWKNISEDRQRKKEFSQKIANRLQDFDEMNRYVSQLLNPGYTEIPDNPVQQCNDGRDHKKLN